MYCFGDYPMMEPTILVIEDNSEDQSLIRRSLEKNTVMGELHLAVDGESALSHLASVTVSNLPHLILLDIRLPGISGLDVLKAIRSNEVTKLIPVVIFSSLIRPEDMDEAYKIGVNSIVLKPVDSDQFSEVVLNTVMYWLLVNRISKNSTDFSIA